MVKKRQTSVAETLKRIIGESGQSRYQIWKKTGVSQTILSRFLNGERDLAMPAVEALCEYFELELVRVSRKRPAKRKER